MDPNSRLRLATRIHFALLRHFNEDVDIRTLLKDGGEAQEALWVCEASGNRELMTLARDFRRAARHELRSGRRSAVPAPPTGTTPVGTAAPTNIGAAPTTTREPSERQSAPAGSPAWTPPRRRDDGKH